MTPLRRSRGPGVAVCRGQRSKPQRSQLPEKARGRFPLQLRRLVSCRLHHSSRISDAMLSKCGTHPSRSPRQQSRAAARQQPVLRAFGKSPAMAAPSSTAPQQVPQTWGDVQRVFMSNPSAAVPAAGIAAVVATRLQQQPLTAIDLSGRPWQTPPALLLCHPCGTQPTRPNPVPAAVGAGVVAFWLVQEWMVHKWLLHSSWDWTGGSGLWAAAFDPVDLKRRVLATATATAQGPCAANIIDC